MSENPSADARIFCIGRNYVEHLKELANPLPRAPLIFMKPCSSLVAPGEPIQFPRHGRELHHEAELVVRIGRGGRVAAPQQAPDFVDGITLGLDLTLRDVQQRLKQNGLPWEAAKAFDQSAPLGSFIDYRPAIDLGDIRFTCRVNGEPKQTGHTRNMIFPVAGLLVELSNLDTAPR